MSFPSDPEAARPDSVPVAFARAATAAGARAALVREGAEVSYAGLRRLQDVACGALIAAGAPRSVALIHDRTPDAVAMLLAVLDSGATLIPIDGAQPDARVETILDDARPELVVAERAEVFAARGARSLAELLAGEPAATPTPTRADERPALVLYTSGSTGAPKAVAWSPRDFSRAVWASTSNVPPADDEVWICKANGGLVDQMDELFGALLRGRPVVLASRDDVAAPRRLVELMAAERVTRFTVVPSYLRILLQSVPGLAAKLPRLRTWVATGEPIDSSLIRLFHRNLPNVALYNDYGTTEAWGLAIARLDAAPEEGRSIALGAAYPGVSLSVVGDDGAPTSAGATGWLAVSSPWLSENARSTLVDGRSLTGDLARRRADGAIELAGRGDGQIKIHGLRIDPVEIEGLLATHPDLLEAAVTSWRGADEREHLVAHFVPRRDRAAPDSRELERHLRGRLPPAWIPAHYQPIAELPRNAGGKLDRRSLPAPRLDSAPRSDASAPTAFEIEIAELLAFALGAPPVGVDDDLRRRGLDSLGVIVAVTALHDRFGVHLAGRDLFELRTAREVAALVDQRRRAEPVAERAASGPSRAAELVPMAEVTAGAVHWEAGGPDPSWNIIERFELSGPLDVERLRAALRSLLDRHEPLRASFVRRESGFAHLISPAVEPELRCHPAAAGEAELEARIAAVAAQRSSERFVWEQVPRVRFDLVPADAGRATLLATLDHLAGDERSIWILGRDLFELYRALASGVPPRLPPVRPLREIAASVVENELRRACEERLVAICAKARGTALVSAERVRSLRTAVPLRARTAEIAPADFAAIGRRAAELGTTTHTLLLAPAVLIRWLEEGLPHVPVSTMLSGRDDPRNASAIGLFDRLALLFVEELDDASTGRILLEEVDRQLRLGWRYQDVDTFGILVREGCVPLIGGCRVNYFHREAELGVSADSPLEIERREVFEPMTMDEWSLQLVASDRLTLRLEGRAEMLSEERAAWGLDTYVSLLRALTAEIDSTLGELRGASAPPPRRRELSLSGVLPSP